MRLRGRQGNRRLVIWGLDKVQNPSQVENFSAMASWPPPLCAPLQELLIRPVTVEARCAGVGPKLRWRQQETETAVQIYIYRYIR